MGETRVISVKSFIDSFLAMFKNDNIENNSESPVVTQGERDFEEFLRKFKEEHEPKPERKTGAVAGSSVANVVEKNQSKEEKGNLTRRAGGRERSSRE